MTDADGEAPPAQKLRLDAPADTKSEPKSDKKTKPEPTPGSNTNRKGEAKAGGSSTVARAADRVVITKKKKTVVDPVARQTDASKRQVGQPVPLHKR